MTEDRHHAKRQRPRQGAADECQECVQNQRLKIQIAGRQMKRHDDRKIRYADNRRGGPDSIQALESMDPHRPQASGDQGGTHGFETIV